MRPPTSRSSFARTPTPAWDDAAPIRGEIFSPERLEEHARSLAAAQVVVPGGSAGFSLSRRLAENEATLIAAYRDVILAISEGAAITPAAEWLADNFHMIEKQIRDVRADLPPGYYRQLPKLAGGMLAGYPRVLGTAWGYIAHTDSHFDAELLHRYLRAYQEIQPLTIGELWAVAITLRIVLIENLARLAARIVLSRAGRRAADDLADQLLGTGAIKAKPPADVLPKEASARFPDAFLVQLVHRLRDQDPNIAPALTWLSEQLANRGTSAEEVVRDEHGRQVSGGVTVRNIITSMRQISDVDWSVLFERVCLVDDVFTAGGEFRAMDFPTRNLYRTAVEQLARYSPLTELQVAAAAVRAAQEAASDAPPADQRRCDPGYYLIAGGRPGFEAKIGLRTSLRAWPARITRALGIGGYVGAGALTALCVLGVPLGLAWRDGLPHPMIYLLALAGFIPAVDLAVVIVNHILTRGFRAMLLPALDLHAGIPPDWRTLIVVPSLLTDVQAVNEQIARLEIHYLASPPGELYFAILSDWTDSPTEHAESDDALLAVAVEGIAALNARYGAGPGGARFSVLHRRRVWSASENCWLGWERKRGKLSELNRLLLGEEDTGFLAPRAVPSGVRYVITLDGDTRVPLGAIARLIGKMAHPLNRPRLDAAAGRVVEGYAILQPRVTPGLPMRREASLFQRIFSSASGIDPYAAAVSDVYQDLFGEGSYAGKGIYDVGHFEAALAGRVPDSTLLSHDLFEGIFARAGLVSDIEVVDDFPARYDLAALRNHRWARGDWQLLPWIIGRGPRSPGATRKGGVPAIGRWKMLDNLRRSLSAPALVVALILGWAMPLHIAVIWTGFILVTIFLPPLLPVLAGLLPSTPDIGWRGHARALASEFGLALVQAALMVIFLAHQAWLMGDAILRTLFRLGVSRRHLLEWTSAAQAAARKPPNVGRSYWLMGGAVVIAAAGLGVALLRGEASWPIATAFAFAWVISPIAAVCASRRPRTKARRALAPADARELRLIARETWRYFETFVTTANNVLPPDNYQETPSPIAAHRTSPTNIGLYLLSTGSARDFGWIGTRSAAARLEATLATMVRMEKFRGHLYNWYDTRDLRPLDPHYVSSVDSGNLAGHLLAMANACQEWRDAVIPEARRFDGIGDALALLRREAASLHATHDSPAPAWRRLDAALEQLGKPIDGSNGTAADRLAELAAGAATLGDAVEEIVLDHHDNSGIDLRYWAKALIACIEDHRTDLSAVQDSAFPARLSTIATSARDMAMAMGFDFLLEPERMLLSIGYVPATGGLDPSCYDLLASEARLASFIAIAKGDVPATHWFRLGHAVTAAAGGAALLSWSGSMFEYLMPSLVMRAPIGSLLEQTNAVVVRRQIEYGKQHGLPWGVSESAYNARDLQFTYQYSNFGIPGLGLKRGLGDNAVVAPYATALAGLVDPPAAVANYRRLEAMGARGRYGFHEAIDFTPDRLPEGEKAAIIRSFMAHHQGMTITAIADILLDGLMRDRFHAEPMIQAAELLLQERAPRDVVTPPATVAQTSAVASKPIETGAAWRAATPWSATPSTHLLSNGRYGVMLTAAGAGYSTWGNLAVTRWREDATCDDWGAYILLRDPAAGLVWSSGLQPIPTMPDSYTATFNEERAEIIRRDGDWETTLEVLVATEDDAEVRRVTVCNLGKEPREIELTSYAELVLAPAQDDLSHPAFSKLFVETEHVPTSGALLATRRARDDKATPVWAAHIAVINGQAVGKREFETDRARFIGRGFTLRAPRAMVTSRPLSSATGAVLDPIFALRRRVLVAPGAAARVDFWTMVASSRDAVLKMVEKYNDTGAFERAVALAWTQAQVQLYHIGISRAEAGQYQRLASQIIYATPKLRLPSESVVTPKGGQPGLWPLGISGDLPILVVRIADGDQLGLAHEVLQALEYWRLKRLAVDVVILNERGTSYAQDVQSALETLVRANQSRPQIADDNPRGHCFLLRADLISAEARALLLEVARVVLTGERGKLTNQLDGAADAHPATRDVALRGSGASELQVTRPPPGVEYFNGLGGFAADGREYVTILSPGQCTPAPWINVIANAKFGFQVSAEGSGYAWSVNSQAFQLTPWCNDPVIDRPGQVIYLRDEVSGEFWTPTASPIRDERATYVARHGWGYSCFEHESYGIASSLLEYVPLDDTVKISRLTLRNASDRPRRISVSAYIEWVLGKSRSLTAPFVATRRDPATGALLANNSWTPTYAGRVAFADLRGQQTGWTCDRREFIGRNGALDRPAALLTGKPLSGRSGNGLDPCAALQTSVDIAPGASVELTLLLGDGANEAEALALITRYRKADLGAVLQAVRQFWTATSRVVQVRTPDRSMDIMLNGWLTYQVVSCRIWARAAFYQASGAYGFRDQLQDCMAVAGILPAITRAHLLRAAGRQFVEGDVQHWWLPETGQGVRTTISDDRAWLAYATAHYIQITGDTAVLDEMAGFLTAEPLAPGEADSFSIPGEAPSGATLYEHCARALDSSLTIGAHGMPLIGGGDWNDGMNRVGAAGRGESVWLGWLLHTALGDFVTLAETRGDHIRVARWRAHQAALATAFETQAWDGDWYKRGWFDDGSPLGAAANEECRIDCIAQSWAVLSGAAPLERATKAMAAVDRELISSHDGLALLFTPPFDRATPDPGYIRGYPPGVRENGGQYTHAALWSVMAFAALGEGDKATALFWMLNPINHSRTRADTHRYKVEPYVIAADVYAAAGHVGRGGWTWYTGSAGWTQRAGIESILGLRVHGAKLHLDPCIPASWPGFDVTLKHASSRYLIHVDNQHGVQRGITAATLDGKTIANAGFAIPLCDDGADHVVRISMG